MKTKLDQFYTNREVSMKCYALLWKFIAQQAMSNPHFIEPSAGDGAFFDILPAGHRTGIDLDPRAQFIKKADFLRWTPSRKISRQTSVVIGNPPFGKRGDTAVQFVNRASLFADTVGFILPVIFRKYFIHKKLLSDMRLVQSYPLPQDAFRLPNGQPYALNADFQIWTRLKTADKDLRKTSPSPITHPHFVMHQYNNTKAALKVFDFDFNFAVPSQGWQDYSRRETGKDKCEKHKQWMLFSAIKPIIDRIHRIDFDRLARQNTTMTPGFRKCDVVEEYTKTYGV